MAQASVLTDLAGEALDLEGRRLGVGEQLGAGHLELDRAGRQLRVDGLGRALDDRADGAEHVLGAQPVAELEGAAVVVGVEDELDDAGAIAQVDEDESAVVAPPVHPARDPRLAPDSVAEHLPAPGVAIAVGARTWKLAHASPPVSSSTSSAVSTGRCSPLAMSRSCAPSSSRMRTWRAPTRLACLSCPLRPRPARSASAESPALRSSPVSTCARERRAPASSATATKTSRPGASPSSSSASAIRSIPAAQPTAGVGGPPSCSTRPS